VVHQSQSVLENPLVRAITIHILQRNFDQHTEICVVARHSECNRPCVAVFALSKLYEGWVSLHNRDQPQTVAKYNVCSVVSNKPLNSFVYRIQRDRADVSGAILTLSDSFLASSIAYGSSASNRFGGVMRTDR